MSPQESAAAVRSGAGLFRAGHRGVLAVRGGDRERWLDGMISGAVAQLAEGPERSGCYAALLTAKGRVVADLQVLRRADEYWLDLEADAVPSVREHLSKFVIADDVELVDRRDAIARLAVEGPATPAVLERALGSPLALAPDCCAEVELAGAPVVAASFGWSGEPALQLFVGTDAAEAVLAALRRAGEGLGLVEAGAETLEILRIEAGVPRQGAELDETVLPAEARLERAIATGKGCYTGQEVVERLRTQGQPSHLLVGLVTEDDETPEVGAQLIAEGRAVGEVTSACHSPHAGSIALGFVRRADSEPGTELVAGDVFVTVSPLPFPGVARDAGV